MALHRTGWSALYDDSSDEEALHGLQAEDSQASSLSFQPHNLFEEHFAAVTAGPSPAAVTDNSLNTLASSTRSRSSRSHIHPSSVAQQQENQGVMSPQAAGAYTTRVRRPWGSSTEAKSGVEQPSDLPAGAQRAASQSPAGKPPLPTAHRLSARGTSLTQRNC